MRASTTAHLTNDEFAAYLVDARADPEVESHLRGCPACRREVAEFGGVIDTFNAGSLAWSQWRSSIIVAESPRVAWRSLAMARASYALAACLAVATGIVVTVHQEHRNPAEMSASSTQEDSEAQIEQDNKLLLAVDQATSRDVPSPMQEYGLADDRGNGESHRQVRNAND